MNTVHNYVGNKQGQEELYLVVFLIQQTELINHELIQGKIDNRSSIQLPNERSNKFEY